MTCEVMSERPGVVHTLAMNPAFGPLLRDWRETRRMTQEQLAFAAEVSTRHVSFVENGRTQPSRQMVLLLATALDVPLRERNALLVAAGFAAVYRETDFEAPELEHVRRAVEFLLTRAEPYPAVVIDSAYNVRRANLGAGRLFAALLPRPPPRFNLLELLFDPAGLRPLCVEWEALAATLLERAHREAVLDGPRSPSAAALREVLARADLPPRLRQRSPAGPLPLVIPVRLRLGDLEIGLFSTLTMLGSPADVTTQELRLESFFPADDATERWVRSLAE